MYVLINTSNLKVGGGIQVADSLIHCLFMYRQHNFVIVLSPALSYLDVIIDGFDRYECIKDRRKCLFRMQEVKDNYDKIYKTESKDTF